MFGRRKPPQNPGNPTPPPGGPVGGNPPHIVRLIETMQVMLADASSVAAALKQGRPPVTASFETPESGPIRCDTSGDLFQHPNAEGTTLFAVYNFSKDMKKMDPNAQVHLSHLIGHALTANAVLQKSNASGQPEYEPSVAAGHVDAVIALSAFYSHFFEGYALSSALLTHSIEESRIQGLLQDYGRGFTDRLKDAQPRMVDGSRLLQMLPDTSPNFLIEASAPYQDGQKVINGVHFPPEYAAAMLDNAAKKQAESMSEQRLAG